MNFHPCAVVPSYNHHHRVGAVVARLRGHDLPVIVVDDGSREETQRHLAGLHDPAQGITVVRRAENGGKGAAVITGLAAARAQGFTHALQVDADGQHCLDDIAKFLDAARARPDSLITGKPVYDQSIPTGRKIGRWVTHIWVWVETCSLAISDSMCGYRVYPLRPTLRVIQREPIGRRMDFDVEIMVRLFWRGIAVQEIPTAVTYPEGNISNFRIIQDNLRISAMHTRLVATMLCRLPLRLLDALIKRRDRSDHWADLEERGVYCGIRFLAGARRLLGRRICLALMMPVVFYFYLTGAKQRRASLGYLKRINALTGRNDPDFLDGFEHYMTFAAAALDKTAAWHGDITFRDLDLPDGVTGLRDIVPEGTGALLIVAHFGNVEVMRALAAQSEGLRLTVLLHQKNAARFNAVLRKINPRSQVDLVEVKDVGPETSMILKDRIDNGEIVVIAGDRVPVVGRRNVVSVPFLGQEAPFPQGPYILAHLFGCPVIMVACWREKGRYKVTWRRLADRVTLPRGQRLDAIRDYAASYAAWLEGLVRAQPYQWFNFYDFWSRPGESADQGVE